MVTKNVRSTSGAILIMLLSLCWHSHYQTWLYLGISGTTPASMSSSPDSTSGLGMSSGLHGWCIRCLHISLHNRVKYRTYKDMEVDKRDQASLVAIVLAKSGRSVQGKACYMLALPVIRIAVTLDRVPSLVQVVQP